MARIETVSEARDRPLSESAFGDTDDPTQKLEDLRTQLSRLAADFTNYRRRSEQEAADRQNHGKAAVLSDVIDIADDIERALAASEADPSSLRDGVAGIYRRLLTVLDKHTVQPIRAIGQPFDPEFHEAIASVPANGVPPDCIAEEHQRGYLFNGKLLRPARVIVARAANGETEQSNGDEEVNRDASRDEGLL